MLLDIYNVVIFGYFIFFINFNFKAFNIPKLLNFYIIILFLINKLINLIFQIINKQTPSFFKTYYLLHVNYIFKP